MGYDISKEDLGGWHIHCTNGSVDNLAEDEEDAAAITRRFLSYLPSSVYETPPVLPADPADPPDRREEELFTLIPRKRTATFDMRKAIRLLADKDSFFEIGPLWGTDQITGLVRFNGHPLGVIASDSRHINGGALTADGCDKLKRHLDMCDVFHIPVLNLVDNPGFAVGLEHEIAGTIRKGGEWMVAMAQVQVPIFTVIARRSFGVAGNNYATPLARPSVRVVWPAADVGGIPPEGGIEAAYKRQLAEAADPPRHPSPDLRIGRYRVPDHRPAGAAGPTSVAVPTLTSGGDRCAPRQDRHPEKRIRSIGSIKGVLYRPPIQCPAKIAPLRHGVLSWYRTLPPAVIDRRRSESAGRLMVRHSCSRSLRWAV